MASLAWLTIKGRPYGFVAAFVAVLAGAATITAAGVLLESGVRGGVEPERYAGAAVVVGADQNLPVPGDLGLTYGERVTLPHDLVVRHTTDRLDAAVLVKGAPGTDSAALGAALKVALRPYPTATVADRASFAAAQNGQLAGQSLVTVFLNGVLLGYIAIAVVNTLVLATAAWSREFALLRLVGAHPRQVLWMMRAETAIVVLTAVAVGLLAALPPLVGVSLSLTESPIPSISPAALAGIVGAAALLGWASIMIPTRAALRARPADAIGGNG